MPLSSFVRLLFLISLARLSNSLSCPRPPSPPPYLAYLQSATSDTPHCHAILVSKTHLLLPAHCHDPSANFSVFFPISSSSSSSSAPSEIHSWHIFAPPNPHPEHPSLITLTSPSPPETSPILLNDNPDFPPPLSAAKLISLSAPVYGASPSSPVSLSTTYSRVLSPAPSCEFHASSTLCTDEICVAHLDQADVPCASCALCDDQSLVAANAQQEAVLVALGARDRGRCQHEWVSSYMRVSRYVDWLRDQGVQLAVGSPLVAVLDDDDQGIGETSSAAPPTEQDGSEEHQPDATPENEGGANVDAEASEGGAEENEAEGGGVSLGVVVGVPVALLVLGVAAVLAVLVVRRRGRV